MNNVIADQDRCSGALARDAGQNSDIPSAFRHAFEPPLATHAAGRLHMLWQAARRWLDRQSDRIWLPRATDPVAELKHVWLGEHGILPPGFEKSRAPAGSDLANLVVWRS